MKLIVAFCKSATEPKMGEGNASIVRILRIVDCCEARLNYYTVNSLFGLVT
jgi:hypothetical protein